MSLSVSFRPTLVACAIFMFVACSSSHTDSSESSTPETLVAFPTTATLDTDQTTPSWEVPNIDPCMLVTKAEAEIVMGSLKVGPQPGGSILDGTVCVYVSTSPLVANVGVISTVSFELQKYDPGNSAINDLGNEAYTTKPNPFKDVYLFVRKGRAAITVNVSGGLRDDFETKRYKIAKDLAEKAVDRLLTVMN